MWVTPPARIIFLGRRMTWRGDANATEVGAPAPGQGDRINLIVTLADWSLESPRITTRSEGSQSAADPEREAPDVKSGALAFPKQALSTVAKTCSIPLGQHPAGRVIIPRGE
jgi:hypothetical protein